MTDSRTPSATRSTLANSERSPRPGLLTRSRRVALRRFTFVVLVAVTWAAGTSYTASLLLTNGLAPLEVACLGLFAILMAPLAISFWLAACGLWVRIRRDPLSLMASLEATPERLTCKTAIVVPVHNEDPQRVAAGIAATHDSLQRTGQLEAFEFFILSDTTDPDVWVEEEIVYDELRRSLPDPSRLRYRKRPRNTEQKAGNLWDFCTRYGDEYRYMIVFDADSVMRGVTLVDMVRLMERNPTAGIVQAPPVPVNKSTFFGRLQQFAARAYGPLFQAGLNFVQCGEGNYYGHNAIIRLDPFRQYCRLPKLEGSGPLAGHIMSHDFVEAAFMRRAGFSVYLADGLTGSYEEPPPTLIDFAARDRRWCQGNLQHSRLLGERGLNTISRIHLAMGIMAYVSAPLWILLLLLATIDAAHNAIVGHSYFATGASLFPVWQVSTATETAILFAAVMGLLFAPKLFAAITLLMDAPTRRRFGGGAALFESVVIESVAATLFAPVMAALQSQFVVITLLGRKVKWTAQERDDVGTPLGVAARRHLWPTTLGLAWAIAAWQWTPGLLPWLAPVLAGLILSIPLSHLTSRLDLGISSRRAGLLLTPEETDPPFLLRRLRQEIDARKGRSVEPLPPGLERVLVDPRVREIHCANLPGELDEEALESDLESHRRDGIQLRYRVEGSGSLTPEEQLELLRSRRRITELAAEFAADRN
jgi:membrane glycosyltransferase